jgi:RHS repeat-associated protein
VGQSSGIRTGYDYDASYTYDLDGNRLTETKGGVRHRYDVTNGLDRTLWSVRGGAFQAPLSGAQNVMAVTDAAGVVTARYRYRAFGEKITLSGGAPNRTDPSFQNRSFDAGLGIYDYRNRQFDPSTGWFLQRDSVLGDDRLFNPYCFPSNNPVTNADPMGTGWKWSEAEKKWKPIPGTPDIPEPLVVHDI